MTYLETTNTEGFKENLEENMKYLAGHISNLPDKSKDFARSLVSSFKRYGSLTDRQIPYAAKLWAEAYEAETGRGRVVPTVERVMERVDCSKLVSLFEIARGVGELQNPHIKFYLTTDTKTYICIGLSRARPTYISFVYTQVGVMGRRFLAHGSMETGSIIFSDIATLEDIELIRSICDAPEEQLKLSGKRAVSCCFCGISLSTNESRFNGYGPICAEKWGLPWGSEYQHSQKPDIMDIV